LDTHTEAHSFVLRIWLEEGPSASRPSQWRGRITNVLDGRERHIQDVNDAFEFVLEYIKRWEGSND
jgi:hypothetical protein